MELDASQVTTEEVRTWKGLHLLHFSGSSCSQKVRILLAEKGLAWESHVVDLAAQENVKPWFLGINPRGVVPVLVHDGAVHVESNDILEYLDALPSDARSFFPKNESERAFVQESLDLEDALHMDLRNLTMRFVMPRRLALKSPAALKAYEEGAAPDAKRAKEIAWWRDFAAKGISDETARASAFAFRDAFVPLDERLASQPWLLGDRVSVLEIAWFISLHRLRVAGYPMAWHPRLHTHVEKLRAQPAFAREIALPGLLGVAFRGYGAFRRLTGSTLKEFLADEASPA